MKTWIISSFVLLWIWYLYYAFPSKTTVIAPLDFQYHLNPPIANLTVSIPPYRTYWVSAEFILPPTTYNHECGIVNLDFSILSDNGIVYSSGIGSMLSSYRSSLVDWCTDFIMMIPYILGIYRRTETLSINLIDDFTPITTKPLSISAKLLHTPGNNLLRFYKANAIFTQYRASLTQIFLYIALSLGFFLTSITFLYDKIKNSVQRL